MRAIEVHSDNDVVQASALHGIYILFTVSKQNLIFVQVSSALDVIYGVMKSKLSDPAIQDGGFKILDSLCWMDESRKLAKKIILTGCVERFTEALEAHPYSPEVLGAGFVGMGRLYYFNDEDWVTSLLAKHFTIIYEALKKASLPEDADPVVLVNGMLVLYHVCENTKGVAKWIDDVPVECVSVCVGLMRRFPSDCMLQSGGIQWLSNLCGYPKLRDEIVKEKAQEVIVMAGHLAKHKFAGPPAMMCAQVAQDALAHIKACGVQFNVDPDEVNQMIVEAFGDIMREEVFGDKS